MRVLIADDDLDLRELVAEAVVAMGAEVVCVSSGGELEDELVAGWPFDAVVTDVSMPIRTGFEVMQTARTAGRFCPIVIMTALRDDRTATQAAALGDRVTLIRKPFSLHTLQLALAACFHDAPGFATEPGRAHRLTSHVV